MIASASKLRNPNSALSAGAFVEGLLVRCSANLFAHRLGLQKQQQVIRTARFGIGAGHVKAAKRMCPNHCACRFAIEIEVAHVKVPAGSLKLIASAGINAAREAKLGIVGDRQSVFEVLGFDDSEHGAEDLFLRNARFAIDVDEYRWLEEVTFVANAL